MNIPLTNATKGMHRELADLLGLPPGKTVFEKTSDCGAWRLSVEGHWCEPWASVVVAVDDEAALIHHLAEPQDEWATTYVVEGVKPDDHVGACHALRELIESQPDYDYD